MKDTMMITLLLAGFIVCSLSSHTNQGKTPVIYVTDLYHPHEDPDDHFDLAAMYSIPQFDIRAIIIDNAKPYKKTPGFIPVEQLNYLANRKIPVYVGLKEKLISDDDTGESQTQYHEGCEAILNCLKKSDKKITMISVGSLRDISAAYNRNPKLFKEKVDKLIIFIGEASKEDNIEYNVSLDKYAFINVMNNIQNVWWVPCFDGGVWKNNGNASLWQGNHSELLEGASDQALNFFIYALSKSADTLNFIQYLKLPVDQEELQSHILDSSLPKRNLWCCSVFPYFVAADKSIFPFTFEKVRVSVDSNAVLHYTDNGNEVMRISIRDKANYGRRMNNIFNELIRSF